LPPLDRDGLAADPIDQFRVWLEQAEREVPLPEAMTLATVDAAGTPNARMVLLKGFGVDGFRFFTNYESAKAKELESNARAALVLYWRELDRQVRIRGATRRLEGSESDSYFATRPRDSQLAATVSPQSSPIDREELERLYREAGERSEGADVARPEGWGGYLLVPSEIEFWQGRESRMHDRFRYAWDGQAWTAPERLAP
jgi:pyridoxamine 5'-phosphate oxidase